MTSLRTRSFQYDLPPELIAEAPLPQRDASRLLVVDRAAGTWSHHRFREMPDFILPSDLLVLNDTCVRPSVMRTVDDEIEITLVEETKPLHWRVMGLPGRKLKPGQTYRFRSLARADLEPASAHVLTTLPGGLRVLRFFGDFDPADYAQLQLPPYIKKKRRELHAAGQPVDCDDERRYQTVYAQSPERAESIAAPTAGLHFTPELIGRFPHAFLTLHVGMGTFRPVKAELVRDHEMHTERFEVPPGLAQADAARRERGGRLVAIGTTSARVLESVASLEPQRGETGIFIYPPYRFKRVEALLTNFHLPESTLLMLVCAFGGTELMLEAYRDAVRERYRFFSYGDAMLIL
ncbi:MAG: tRNA preQ1(34) S-adenosylmethionine ribosyltransferase-isomerase QueA [Verrucomicrobiota bacterium]